MTELQRVELPNGQIVDDVPVGISQAELLDKLSRNNTITADEAAAWGLNPEVSKEAPQAPLDTRETPVANDLESRLPPSMRTPPPVPEGPSWEDLGSAITGNMDIPGGIAGSIAGAKAGTPFGPYGVLAGTVAGGAIGTFGGDILSDYLMSDEPDIPAATKNAAISAGIDTVTLGAAAKFKSAMKLLGFDGNEIANLWKTYSNKLTNKTSPALEALPVGSAESKLQTQALLEKGGGSLTAYQTGNANTVQRISEGIGEVGVISGAGYRALEDTNAKTIAQGLQELIETGWSSTGINMGPAMAGTIDAGKKAASGLYDESMQQVSRLTKGATVNPKWIVGQFNNWRKAGATKAGFSEHSNEALKLAREWQNLFEELPSMSVEDLLKFQKKINGQISDMGAFGSDAVQQRASRDLADLSKRIRTTTEALLKEKNPKAYGIYKDANLAYGEAMEGLLPKLNLAQVTSAKKGDYESLARVIEGKNPDKVEALLKSIDTAYNNARLAGIDVTEYGGVATAKEAKDLIRNEWMRNIFGDVSAEGFDPKSFTKLASNFEKPANQRVAKAILGQDFPKFKSLLNAISESSDKQQGFLGALVLRSKEHQAISGALQGGAALTGTFAAAPILFGPVLLAKAVSSPSAVRALLEGNKRAGAAQLAGKVALANSIMDSTFNAVMSNLSEEDQAEVRQAVRQGNQ